MHGDRTCSLPVPRLSLLQGSQDLHLLVCLCAFLSPFYPRGGTYKLLCVLLFSLYSVSQRLFFVNMLRASFFKKRFIIYLFLFYFWLRWVLVAAHRLLSSCGVRVFSSCGTRAPEGVGSLVEGHKLSSCGVRA